LGPDKRLIQSFMILGPDKRVDPTIVSGGESVSVSMLPSRKHFQLAGWDIVLSPDTAPRGMPGDCAAIAL